MSSSYDTSVYRVNKAVRARLLILVDLVDDQEDHTHQEGQSTDHQQSHLKETQSSTMLHHKSTMPDFMKVKKGETNPVNFLFSIPADNRTHPRLVTSSSGGWHTKTNKPHT